MIESEVLERVARGEDNRTEFKENWEIRPEQLAREIVSFANMYGGHILIGVSDSGDIVGVSEDRQEWLMDTVIRRYVHPSIFIIMKHKPSKIKKLSLLACRWGRQSVCAKARRTGGCLYPLWQYLQAGYTRATAAAF